MTNRFLMSVAAAALIAGTGLANAQGTGMGREPSAGAASQQSAPSSAASPAATPMNRNDASDSKGSDSDMKASRSDEKMQPGGSKSQRAQDTAPGQKPKTMSSENNDKAGKESKDEERNGKTNAADSKGAVDKNNNAESKSAADGKPSTTTGQAGAGAKLSGEQRSKITTVIKQQNVRPETNINFSISLGTRVPRTVSFHPLPEEIVSVYPDWRGYEFFLVGDQIIVVNPGTFEIVAVLDV
jgi:Protein of unknown function (DUF1236)